MALPLLRPQHRSMSARGRTLLVTSMLLIGLLVAGSVLPVPYVALRPGPTVDTLGEADGEPLIVIEGRRTYDTTGQLNLTTVSVVDGLQLPAAVRGWLDGRIAVVPRQVIYPPGQTEEEVEEVNTQAMMDSQTAATTAALRALDIPVETMVAVGSLSPDSPAQGVLQPDDVIVTVDGERVTDPATLRRLIQDRQVGDEVSLGYLRDGQRETATVQTMAGADGTPVVGFLPVERAEFPFTVDIKLEDIGGPSAGLMFALGIYDKLTPSDLTGGAFVAGTGSINAAGQVAAIGGIQQKMIAARQAGATIFLVPDGNCADAALDPPGGLRLVRVADLEDAVSALEALRTPGGAEPPTCMAA